MRKTVAYGDLDFRVSIMLFPIAILLMALICLCSFVVLGGLFSDLGSRIPSNDLLLDYATAATLACIIIPLILFLPLPFHHRVWLLKAWSIRCFVVLFFSLFYEHTYGLDAYSYFRAAEQQSFSLLLKNCRFGDGTANITLIIKSLTVLLPATSYHGLKVVFAFLGLMSAYVFFRALKNFLGGREDQLAFWVFSCVPSGLFWTSILGKEPVVLLGLSLLAWGVSLIYIRRPLEGLILLGTGLAIAAAMRIWLLPIFAAPLMIVVPLMMFRNLKLRLAVWGVGIVLGFILLKPVFLRLGAISSESLLTTVNHLSQSWAYGGSSQVLPKFGSIWELVNFLPIGIFTAIYRPMPGDVANLFGWVAGLENLMLLIVSLFSGTLFLFRAKNLPLFPLLFLAGSVVVWSAAYSFVSYQNLGTAFRFRTQITPFILMAMFLIFNCRAKVLSSY